MDLTNPTTVALIWALLTTAIVSAALVLFVAPRVIRFILNLTAVIRVNRRVKRMRPNWTRAQRNAFLSARGRINMVAWERAEVKRARKASKGTTSRLPADYADRAALVHKSLSKPSKGTS